MANAWNSHTSRPTAPITAAPILALTPACRGTAGCSSTSVT
jgi:hypothetical protein